MITSLKHVQTEIFASVFCSFSLLPSKMVGKIVYEKKTFAEYYIGSYGPLCLPLSSLFIISPPLPLSASLPPTSPSLSLLSPPLHLSVSPPVIYDGNDCRNDSSTDLNST